MKKRFLQSLFFVSALLLLTFACSKDEKEETPVAVVPLKVEIVTPTADTTIKDSDVIIYNLKITPQSLQNQVSTSVYIDGHLTYVMNMGTTQYYFNATKYGLGNHNIKFVVEDNAKRTAEVEQKIVVSKIIILNNYNDSVVFSGGVIPDYWKMTLAQISSVGYQDGYSLAVDASGELTIPIKGRVVDSYFSFLTKGEAFVTLTTDLSSFPLTVNQEIMGDGWIRNTYSLLPFTQEVKMKVILGTFNIDNVIHKEVGLPTFDEFKCDTLAAYDHYAVFSAKIHSVTGKLLKSGFCWSNVMVKPTIADYHVDITDTMSFYSRSIKPFKQGSKAYVRAYAVNEVGIVYSKVVTIGPPALRPAEVAWSGTSKVYGDTAIFSNATIVNEYLSPVTERGYCMSKEENPTIDDLRVRITNANAAFTGGIGRLEEHQDYWVRAYAISKGGIGYSPAVRITTITILEPEPNTRKAINIRRTTATLLGNLYSTGNSTILSQGIIYGLNENLEFGTGEVAYTTTNSMIIEANVSGLQGNTTYYFRAFAINNKFTAYGEVKSFTTGPYDLFDNAEGGRIIYLKDDGLHGMVMAESDLGQPVMWAGDTTSLIGTVSNPSGSQNTYLIASATIGEDNAANRCYNLSLNGYNDWFLPSFEEFKLCLGGAQQYGLTSGNYWLSNERSANKALFMNLGTLSVKNDRKTAKKQVRPFRSF